MKTTKRVLAVVLAVLMLAMAIPFAVSAAALPGAPAETAFTLKTNKADFTYSVYTLATLDSETGLYENTSGVSEEIFNLIKQGNPSTATKRLVALCDEATFTNAAAEFTSTSSKLQEEIKLPTGVYYVKATKKPVDVTSVTNSVFASATFNGTNWAPIGTVELSSKYSTSTADVDKIIVDSKIENAGVKDTKNTTAELGETVTFRLSATRTGSASNKLTSYVITDTMSEGLSFDANTGVTAVKLTGGAAADKTLAKTTDYTVAATATGFTVSMTSTLLGGDDFYKYNTVVVDCQATLNEKAVIAPDANINSDRLDYSNGTASAFKDGPTVNVYTFGLKVKKVNENDQALAGAKFGVYATSANASNDASALAYAISGNDGEVNFSDYKFDAEKKYYVKEVEAPNGYSINTKIYEVTIDRAKGLLTGYNASVPTIENVKPVLPQTGGAGNAVFYVIGASLIACAGVLLVVVMRKRAK